MAVSDRGQVLFVDLTSGSIQGEILEEKLYREFLGGSGLGARILYERMKPKVDPLGPDNMLGFVAGLLTGTQVPTSARWVVVGKSPLTSAWGESNSGGAFGHELRAAGYSGVFFTGIAPKPVYLWLNDGKAELRDANHLWGKLTDETEESLRQELNDKRVKIACVGPAGEALSLLALVMSGEDAAGMCGLGAVIGSKNLKAIAVRGTGKIPVADSKRVNTLRKKYIEDAKDVPLMDRYLKYGTSEETFLCITEGITGIKNWSLLGGKAFPNASNFDPATLRAKYWLRRESCWGCPVGCKADFRIEKGLYAREKAYKRPEYETWAAFGPMCLNEDPELVIKANDICNRYGIDTISTGSVIAFAMECYERGIIGKKETEGIELTWGNTSAMLGMLNKVVRREGFGALLADGTKRASERIGKGSEEWAIHISGQEPAFHDARHWPARGLFYIADPTPGHHTCSTFPVYLTKGTNIGPYPELKFAKKKLDELLDYEVTGPIYATGNSYYHFITACGLCLLANYPTSVPSADYVSAVTGWNFTMSEGLRAGRRIQTLRQAFNMREGLRPEDFRLPKRISMPSMAGNFAGKQIDFDTEKHIFYREMGWDTKTGWPLETTLHELGLIELVNPDRNKAVEK